MFNLYLSTLVTEVKRIFTTYSICTIMILGPLAYFFIYPQPYNNEVVREIPIGIINQDNTTESQALIRQLDATDAIHVTSYFHSIEEAKVAVENHDIYGLVLIPFNYEKKILAGEQSPIAFYGDASYSLIYGALATAVTQTTTSMGASISTNRLIAQGADPSVAKGSSQPFLPVTAMLFNPEVGYATFIIPPVFILILHQILFLGVCLTNISARHTSAEQNLIRSYPHINRLLFILLLGKLSVYLVLYSFYFWFFVLFSSYWYQLPQLGQFSSLFGLSLLLIVVVSLAGIVFSFVAKTMENILVAVIPVSMFLFFLAGISWPYELMPSIYKFGAMLIPASSLMNAFVKFHTMGGDWSNAQGELKVLCAQIFVFALLAVYYMRKYIKKTIESKATITATHYDE